MSPVFDYRCIVCNRFRPDVQVSNWNDATATHQETCECGGEMRKQPAAPNFTVKGFNAANSYGTKP